MQPAQVSVSVAAELDAKAIAEVHVRAWQAGYRGLLSEALLQSRSSVERRSEQWLEWIRLPERHVLVSKLASSLTGFCATGPARDADAAAGVYEIYSIYVDPAHWRAGHGRALMLESLSLAGDADAHAVTLWVLERNEAARSFYARLGFVPDGVSKLERMGDSVLSELRYRLVFAR